MKTRVCFTIDVEQDLHTGEGRGITEGIPRLLKLLDKHNIKATFFVTYPVLKKNKKVFFMLKKKGHEIASHSYSHKRLDKMKSAEKKKEIEKSFGEFRKLGFPVKGFRAPQHSADSESLRIIQEYFYYDSSITSQNLLQLIFLPNLISIKQFFLPNRRYRIGKMMEFPVTSFLVPFTSISLQFAPMVKLKILFLLNRILRKKQIILYCHSYNLIDISKSRISRLCPAERFLRRLDNLFSFIKEKADFCRMEDLLK